MNAFSDDPRAGRREGRPRAVKIEVAVPLDMIRATPEAARRFAAAKAAEGVDYAIANMSELIHDPL